MVLRYSYLGSVFEINVWRSFFFLDFGLIGVMVVSALVRLKYFLRYGTCRRVEDFWFEGVN